MFLPIDSNIKIISGSWENGLIILMSFCIGGIVHGCFRTVESPLPALLVVDLDMNAVVFL